MFFIMGITPGRKDLDFHQTIICGNCGAYGRYSVYVTYMVLTLFFIPIFKWGKRYYVETSCCHRVYELDPEIGKAIAKGENIEITPDDLLTTDIGRNSIKVCKNCGFRTQEDFDFCPKCGERFY